MSPDEFRAARRRLGLSDSQMATALGVSPTQVRRMEVQVDKSSHRPVSATTAKLVEAYLSGYRPPDWPLTY